MLDPWSATTSPADLCALNALAGQRERRRKKSSPRGRLLTVAIINLMLMAAGLWLAPHIVARLIAS